MTRKIFKLILHQRRDNKNGLTYSGIFYESVTPKYFLQAFKEISVERPDIAANIELEFIGHLRDENKKLIIDLGLNEFVRDYGYMEHIESVKKLRAADVLWMMIGNQPNADTISTSKLFEYFGTQKPVLGCVPEGAASIALKEYGASFVCEPEDINAIKNKIIEIHNLYISKGLPFPNEEFVNRHDRIALTEQLTTAFQFYLKA
jgi:glycosyltransferase involved in cell wall biosynthesis